MRDFEHAPPDHQRSNCSNSANSPSPSLSPPITLQYGVELYAHSENDASSLTSPEIVETSIQYADPEHVPSPTTAWGSLSPYFEFNHAPYTGKPSSDMLLEANGSFEASPLGHSSRDVAGMLAPSVRDRAHMRHASRSYSSARRPNPYPRFPILLSSHLCTTTALKCLRRSNTLNVHKQLISCHEPDTTCTRPAGDILLDICSDKAKYKRLLQLNKDASQLVLDVMSISDRANLMNYTFESVLLNVMLRISQRYILFPRSYTLNSISREEYPVASGHFGEVYQGSYNGQKVSLKVFKLYSSAMTKVNDLLKSFYKEAILWRNLSHPNLLPFYGIYQLSDSGKRICLVSPWMSNGNITQYLQENPEANRLHLTLDIACGISYLHEKSIVHGDLKGANVLVSDSGVAWLADFETTKSNAGTVRWQAPELISGAHDSGRTKESDIYAFACVCYEVFVGKVPFHEFPNDVTVIHKVMTLGQRPSQPTKNSLSYTQWGLTGWIWSLMQGCWRENPSTRPMASDVVEMLSSRKEFQREDKGDHNLKRKLFKAHAYQYSSPLVEVDVQRCITLLNTL